MPLREFAVALFCVAVGFVYTCPPRGNPDCRRERKEEKKEKMASANKDDRILDVLENRLVERLYQRILQREEGVDSRGGAARRPARGRSGRSRSESHRGRRPRRRSLSGYRQHYHPRQCPHTDGEEDDEGGDGGGGDGSHRGHRGYPWKRARCDSDEKMKKEREVLRYGGKEGRARRPQHEADVSSRSLVSMSMHTQGGDKGDKGPREGTRGKGGGHGGTQWPRGGPSDCQSDGRGGKPGGGSGWDAEGTPEVVAGSRKGEGHLAQGVPGWGGRVPPTPMSQWEGGDNYRRQSQRGGAHPGPSSLSDSFSGIFNREENGSGNWTSSIPVTTLVPKSSSRCVSQGAPGKGEKEGGWYERGRRSQNTKMSLQMSPTDGKFSCQGSKNVSHDARTDEPDIGDICTAEQDPYYVDENQFKDRVDRRGNNEDAQDSDEEEGENPFLMSAIGVDKVSVEEWEQYEGEGREEERVCDFLREEGCSSRGRPQKASPGMKSSDTRLSGTSSMDLCLSSKAPAWVVQPGSRGGGSHGQDECRGRGEVSGRTRVGKGQSDRTPAPMGSHELAQMPVRGGDFGLDGKGKSQCKKGKGGEEPREKVFGREGSSSDMVQSNAQEKRTRMASVLKGLGPPRFKPEDREVFEKLFTGDPIRLRKKIAREYMDNPDWGSRRMCRHLFNKFGAKTEELKVLFACDDPLEMKEWILEKYHRTTPEKKERRARRRMRRLEGGSISPSPSGAGAAVERERPRSKGPTGHKPESQKHTVQEVLRGVSGCESTKPSRREEKVAENVRPPARGATISRDGMEGASDRPAALSARATQGRVEQEHGREWSAKNQGKGKSNVGENWDNKGKPMGKSAKSKNKGKQTGKGDTHTHNRSTPYQVQQQSWMPPSPPIVPTAARPTSEWGGRSKGDGTTPQVRGDCASQVVVKKVVMGAEGGNACEQVDKPVGKKPVAKGRENDNDNNGPGGPAVSAEDNPGSAKKAMLTPESGSVVVGGGWRASGQPAWSAEVEHEKIFGHPERFGSVSKVSDRKWEVVMHRHPTRLTKEEKAYALECVQAVPPAIRKHGFCPVNAPTMLRCPIGGGTCRYSILNSKTLRQAIQTHFNLHHKSIPANTFEIKVENNRGGFTYIQYPVEVHHMGKPGTDTFLSAAHPVGSQKGKGGTQPATGDHPGEQSEPMTDVAEKEEENAMEEAKETTQQVPCTQARGPEVGEAGASEVPNLDVPKVV